MEEHLPEESGCKTPTAHGSEGEAVAEQESEQSDNSEAGAQSDSEPDSDDNDKDEGDCRKRRFTHRGRRTWTELANFDRTALLDSEVEAAILTIATEKMQESGLMEWPEIKQADKKKTIGLWVRNEEHWKQRGTTQVETYYCPLRNRCGCRVQLRITRAPALTVLEWSGGPHTYELCHSEDASKTLSVKQRVAVAKLARANPHASGMEVRRAVKHFSPNSKVEAGMLQISVK